MVPFASGVIGHLAQPARRTGRSEARTPIVEGDRTCGLGPACTVVPFQMTRSGMSTHESMGGVDEEAYRSAAIAAAYADPRISGLMTEAQDRPLTTPGIPDDVTALERSYR